MQMWKTNLFRWKIHFLDHITVIYLRISYQIADLKPESGFLTRKIWFLVVLDMRNRFGAPAKGSLPIFSQIEAFFFAFLRICSRRLVGRLVDQCRLHESHKENNGHENAFSWPSANRQRRGGILVSYGESIIITKQAYVVFPKPASPAIIITRFSSSSNE